MKYLPILLLLAGTLRGQGIAFEHDTWANLLAKAKTEKKLIFVDAYTTWCGPCKALSRDVFPQEKVGAYFNANFINTKIDMEKGEGVDLALTYNVELYPTLLFIDGSGRVIHRAVGYHSADDLLVVANSAIDPMNTFFALDLEYRNGTRTEEFLYRHLRVKAVAADTSVQTLAQEYLQVQRDWSTERALEVIFSYIENPNTEAYRYFLKNNAAFETKYSAQAVQERRINIFNNYRYAHRDHSLADYEKLITEIFPEKDHAYLTSLFRRQYFEEQGDTLGFARAAIEHYDRFPSDDPTELNGAAWLFYLYIDDPKQLRKALDWALRSIKLDEAYYNQDTAAALYFKLGQKKEAKEHALRAIELAKALGEDASATEALLEKIGN